MACQLKTAVVPPATLRVYAVNPVVVTEPTDTNVAEPSDTVATTFGVLVNAP